jgi:hypothetical protein
VQTNTVAVSEPPMVVSAPITVSGKNQSNVQVATFTHANGVEPASDFIATINWGDGTTSTGTISRSGTTYSVKSSHTYASGGSHTVTAAVAEAESGMVAHMMGALSMAIAADDSVSAGSTSAATVTIQPAALASGPQPLNVGLVDQVLSGDIGSRKGRARLAHSDAASNDGIDDLFAMV